MLCSKCGKNTEGNLTVCPFCNNPMGNNANPFFKVPGMLDQSKPINVTAASPDQSTESKGLTGSDTAPSNKTNETTNSDPVLTKPETISSYETENPVKPENFVNNNVTSANTNSTSAANNNVGVAEVTNETVQQPTNITNTSGASPFIPRDLEVTPMFSMETPKPQNVLPNLNMPQAAPFEIPKNTSNSKVFEDLQMGNTTPNFNSDSNIAASIEENNKSTIQLETFSKKPKNPKMPKKAHIMASVICLIISLAMVTASSAYMIFGSLSIPKASDAVTDGRIASSGNEMQYDIDNIQKTSPDTSFLDTLSENKEATTKVRQEIDVVEAAIAASEAKVKENYPEITTDSLYYYLNEASNALNELRANDQIGNYTKNRDCVVVTLNDGAKYIYSPSIPGRNAGSKPELKIATYQTLINTKYTNSPDFKTYIDDAAQYIANNIEEYTFTDSNFDEEKVDMYSLSRMGGYNIIIFDGHGCYDDTYGSLMSTGIVRTEETDIKFHELLNNNEMFYTSNGYMIGSKFISNRIQDGSLEKTIVYLGTCESGNSSELADAFLEKGAEAVYAAYGMIETKYNAKFVKSLCEGLVKSDNNETLYNVKQALEYAQDRCGQEDSYGAYIKLFSNNETFALDWYKDSLIADRDIVLVLDGSGSMSGVPIEQTKEATIKFIDTILEEQNVRISIVSFSSDSSTLCNFTNRKEALKAQVDNIYQGGGTDTLSGLETADKMLDSSKANKKIIVLMSDGDPDYDVRDQLVPYAQKIKDKGTYLYTLGFFHSNGGHDVARTLMKEMASDSCYHDVTNSEDLVFFFGDIADVINGQKQIYVRIACPVSVKVSRNGEELNSDDESLNTHTSFGTLSFESEEETDSSSVSSNSIISYKSSREYLGYGNYNGFSGSQSDEDESDNRVKILRLKDGMEYDIEIIGTGDGSMDYTIQFMDEKGNYSDKREFNDIDISTSTEIATVASSNAEETVLSVDSDGDGNYDEIYTAKANSKAELYDDILNDISFYCLIIFTILAVLSLIAFFLLKKQKKDYLNSLKS